MIKEVINQEVYCWFCEDEGIETHGRVNYHPNYICSRHLKEKEFIVTKEIWKELLFQFPEMKGKKRCNFKLILENNGKVILKPKK